MSGIRPTPSRLTAPVAVATVLAAVALAGCSSSAAKAKPGVSSGGTSSAPVTSTSSGVSSAAAASPSASSSSSSGGGGGSAAGSGFCQQAALAEAAQVKAAKSFSVGSPDSLRTIEEQGLAVLRSLTVSAPSAIRGDFAALADADQKLYTALKAVNFDVRKVSPGALSSLNTPAFTSASQRIGAYLSKSCGIKVPTP